MRVLSQRWVALLGLGGLFVACGGRANSNDNDNDSAAGAVGEAGHAPNAGGSGVSAAAGKGGGATAGEGGATAGAGEGGATAGEGGSRSPGGDGGAGPAGGAGGADGGGGAGGEPPTTDVLVGDYDLFLEVPPVVAGCSVTWYEPRLNLSMVQVDSGKLEALPFVDFFWQPNFAELADVTDDHVLLAPTLDWDNRLRTPTIELGRDADGFTGQGSALIWYDCPGAASTQRRIDVSIETDRTSPKLRVAPDGHGSFAFTRFDFKFSEPVQLPSGSYLDTFSETADGEQVVELYDVDTNAALTMAWKWALGGPVAQAHFIDQASAEGVTMAARVIAAVTDHAGNPLVPLAETYDIAPAALLQTQLDLDQEPVAGIYGNASYHAVAEPGAACEQGGCLTLDGPVVACYSAPASTFAVRVAGPWDDGVDVRYRVWASTKWVSPLEIGFASGCTGWFSTELSPLAQPDGAFTYASDWQTKTVVPCGGPENENGFTLSLGCAESSPVPEVRVVVERLTRRPWP